MSIWQIVTSGIRGGWRTHGPNAASSGAYDSGSDDFFGGVTYDAAIKLSAVHACVKLRAEIVGSLPLQVRDGEKNIIRDHPLSYLFSISPNADMTPPEFWSLATAMIDMKGNSVNIIDRTGGRPVALIPVDPDFAKYEYNKSGSRKKWTIGKDTYSDEDILHLRGFSLHRDWGLSALEAGRNILQAQLTANRSASLAFKQGLKVGGFFVNKGTRDFTPGELTQFAERMATYSRPENMSKWMTLLRGMEPIAGTEFSVKPHETQLLESRYFGIEEICRLWNTPPPLIGHTNKASSWASSIENINLFYLMYSLQPMLVRNEASILKKMVSSRDQARGVRPKFNVRGLLRADTAKQTAEFASSLQNGYYCVDEVRDLLDLPPLPNGEGKVYRVQLNMGGANNNATSDQVDALKKTIEELMS